MGHIELPKNYDIKGIYFLSIFFYYRIQLSVFIQSNIRMHMSSYLYMYVVLPLRRYLCSVDETFFNDIKKNLYTWSAILPIVDNMWNKKLQEHIAC